MDKYKIVMHVKRTGTMIDMPSDHNLSKDEALMCQRLYTKRNPDCIFYIAFEDTETNSRID